MEGETADERVREFDAADDAEEEEDDVDDKIRRQFRRKSTTRANRSASAVSDDMVEMRFPAKSTAATSATRTSVNVAKSSGS